MDACIREHRALSRLFRIIAPTNARIVGVIRASVESMSKFHDHDFDPSELSRVRHGLRLTHHRIAREPEIHAADAFLLSRETNELLGLGDVESKRLLTQHVESGVEECPHDFEMGGVWRRHRHKVKAVGSLRLRIEHFSPRSIGPVLGEPEINPIRVALCRIDIHGAGRKLEQAVHTGGDPVCDTDLAA